MSPSTLLASPTPPTSVSPAGLVLLLHMEEPAWDETRDQVVDSSGLGHNGTSTRGATTVAAGKFGRAGSFSGNRGCVEIADMPTLRPTTQLTLSAWIYPDRFLGGEGIIGKQEDDTGAETAYALFLNGANGVAVDIDTADNRFGAGPTFTTERWYHLAVVYDGSLPRQNRTSVYVDGKLAGTGSENAPSISAFTSPVWVGCLPHVANLPDYGYSGLLDEVAVWHRALMATEILLLAKATGPIPTP